MKANWKIALMCLTMVAFAVSCNPKNQPTDPSTTPSTDSVPSVDPGYVSPINVKDNSVADWDALDPTKVAVANVTAEPYFAGLKQLKVYSDGVYINYMLVFDPTIYTSHVGAKDGMHIYMNIDNSAETGGFFDLFADAAVDLMFEGELFDDQGNPVPYSPTMHRWVGQEGGLPSERNCDAAGGWDVAWEAAGSVKGESQLIGNNIIEGRLVIGLISDKFAAEGFGIGFDIQQNWEGVGLLPQLDAQGEQGEFIGRTNMLFVPFDESEE